MYTFLFNPEASKPEFYKQLKSYTSALIEGQRNWVTNLANVSSLIYHGLNSLEFFKNKPVNWAGFYLRDELDSTSLILGPFQGKVACTKIKIGRGVCGTAASQRITQVVPNVHEFPGHIACDSESLSEIVVPMIHPKNGQVIIGVLDIDDTALQAFDQQDAEGLEAVVKILIDGCDWPF